MLSEVFLVLVFGLRLLLEALLLQQHAVVWTLLRWLRCEHSVRVGLGRSHLVPEQFL